MTTSTNQQAIQTNSWTTPQIGERFEQVSEQFH